MNAAKHAIEIIEQMYCVLLMTNVKEVKMVINAATIHDDVKEMLLKLTTSNNDNDNDNGNSGAA